MEKNKTEDSCDLIELNSPAKHSKLLVPEIIATTNNNSPLLTQQISNVVSEVSPSAEGMLVPMASSTPVLEPINSESNPFDYMAMKASETNDNNPFDMVEAEAAQMIDAVTSDNTLNVGFLTSNCATTSSASEDKSVSSGTSLNDVTCSLKQNEGTGSKTYPSIKVSAPGNKQSEAQDEDLFNVSPPWSTEAETSEADQDVEKLMEIMHVASLNLAAAMEQAELLSDESIQGLELQSPSMLRELDDTLPLDLEVPPLSLDTSVLSLWSAESPLVDSHLDTGSPLLNVAPRQVNVTSQLSLSHQHKVTDEINATPELMKFTSKAADEVVLKKSKLPTPRVPTRTLGVITNSELPRLSTKLPSRLLIPKSVRNKENF